MSGAHSVTWWGSLDPYTFGCWFNEDKVFDLPEPLEADRLLILSLLEPPGEQHRRYIDALTSDRDRAVAFTAFTAYTHEWRHWYDSTSTPFGLTRMGQLAGFFATVSQVDDEIRSLPKLFVPLHRWIRQPQIVALAYPGLELPSLQTCEAVVHAHRILRKADIGLRATYEIDGVVISTSQILEGLAMLTQEEAADRAFGTGAADEIRRYIKLSDGGRMYYSCIDLLAAKGCLSRECQIKILETTLFVNYGVYGSETPFTPPVILSYLMSGCDFAAPNQAADTSDELLRNVQGFDRWTAHSMTYEMTRKHYNRVLDTATEGLPGARLRRTLANSMLSASLIGGVARFRDRMSTQLTTPVELPSPSAYSYKPPFYVEGYPGIIQLESDTTHINTLIGASFQTLEALNERFKGFGGVRAYGNSSGNEPHRLSVVWTPKLEDGDPHPEYFAIQTVFRELMYWRVVMFGSDSMSPFTYYYSVKTDALATGQVILE